VFAVVIGRRVHHSPSIYPDDRESVHYDPHVFAHEEAKAPEPSKSEEDAAYGVMEVHTDDEIMGFLRSMLHEIRAKRHEMVTHQNVDDLKKPLGFSSQAGAPSDKGDPESSES
jgi:hypothetical protein